MTVVIIAIFTVTVTIYAIQYSFGHACIAYNFGYYSSSGGFWW